MIFVWAQMLLWKLNDGSVARSYRFPATRVVHGPVYSSLHTRVKVQYTHLLRKKLCYFIPPDKVVIASFRSEISIYEIRKNDGKTSRSIFECEKKRLVKIKKKSVKLRKFFATHV